MAIPLVVWFFKFSSTVFLPLGIAIVAFHPMLPWFLSLLSDEQKSQREFKATLAVSCLLMLILSTVVGLLAMTSAYGLSQQPQLLDQMKVNYESAIGSDYLGQILGYVQSTASELFPILPGLALFLFIAWEYPPQRKLFLDRFTSHNQSRALQEFESEGTVLKKFWLARTLGGFLTGAAVGGALFILGVPMSWLWGTINFLLNFIPTVGSIIGILLPIGFAMVVDVGAPVWEVALAVGSIQLIFGTFVDPLIQDRFLPLSSLTVFVSIIFWGWLWGPWGALIGVPLTFTLARLSLHHSVYEGFGKLVLQDLKE